ncbi:MAG: potassium transporter TrkG [Candidatus Cyclobacteriaceae bacterium M3_2C_046]
MELKSANQGLLKKYLLTGLSLTIFVFLVLKVYPGNNSSGNFLEVLFNTISLVTLTGIGLDSWESIRGGKVLLLILFQTVAIFHLSFVIALALQVKGQPRPFWDIFLNITWLLILLELVFSIPVFMTWDTRIPFASLQQKALVSFFHSASAFCQAGFTTFSLGFSGEAVKASFISQIALLLPLIIGGLGYFSWNNLFNRAELRKRLKNPKIDWRAGTKIALFFSSFLLIASTIIIFGLENKKTLDSQRTVENIIMALFNAASARTTGFSTFDVSQLQWLSILILIILMFIGGSPVSLAGGIKTVTIYLVQLRPASKAGKKIRNLAGKLLIWVFLYNLTGFLIIFLLENQSGWQILFLQFSSFSTTGLESLQVSSLQPFSQIILMLNMILGRFGLVCLGYHWMYQERETLLAASKNDLFIF